MASTPVTQAVATMAKQLPEGAILSAKELLHLGNRAAIDQALKRLEARKELMRAGWGLYVRPVHTRFGPRAPSPEKVVEQLALSHAETIAKHGAAEANALGLTTQVALKPVYLTTGRSRKLKLGKQTVELKHVQPWLVKPSRAGRALRALLWIGKPNAGKALEVLKVKLPQEAIQELVASRSALPGWLSKSISEKLVPRG